MSYARVYAKGGDTTTIGKEHKAGLLGRAIHGQFFTAQEQIEGVDLKMSHLWLQRAHLRFETEALVCAAQEQALPTNWMKAKIWKMGVVVRSSVLLLFARKNGSIAVPSPQPKSNTR